MGGRPVAPAHLSIRHDQPVRLAAGRMSLSPRSLARVMRTVAVATLVGGLLLATAGIALGGVPATVSGTVKDQNGAFASDVCVVLGPVLPPSAPCAATTDASGHYSVQFYNVKTTWELQYVKSGFAIKQELFYTDGISTFYVVNTSLVPGSSCPPTPGPHLGTPTQTTYLPNITKTLGGPLGWYTPFIVQNTGTANADLEIDFFKFSDGSLVARRLVNGLKPGTSFADVPNNDCDLPDWGQFSVVVSSFGANVVAVVNEHQGSGTSAEAGSYVGASSGATSVYLPNIVRRFFGFHTPFIIQNLGTGSTIATASFVSFDGTKTATVLRNISPGQSQFVEPNVETGLVDGTQYAVTVTASQPLSVVVNTHRDEGVATPVMYSVNGYASGAPTLYGPYAVKNVPGVGQGISTIVVQNMSSSPVTPSLNFTSLSSGGAPTAVAGPTIGAGKAWAFDPRYTNGDTTKPKCGSSASSGCLADGEYSFVASAGGLIAAQVNVIWETAGGEPQTAAGYSAVARTASKVYLPNITRTLGGASGWTTPLVVQSAGATNVTVSWFRFSDGSLAATQQLSLQPNAAARVDPRTVGALVDNTQYSVVLDGNGGSLAAIVTELNFQGGDGAMTYEGFPAP